MTVVMDFVYVHVEIITQSDISSLLIKLKAIYRNVEVGYLSERPVKPESEVIATTLISILSPGIGVC